MTKAKVSLVETKEKEEKVNPKYDGKGYGNKGKSGKGKYSSPYTGKGTGDPQRDAQQKKTDPNACLYCGKHGRWFSWSRHAMTELVLLD